GPPTATLFPYTTLFRSYRAEANSTAAAAQGPSLSLATASPPREPPPCSMTLAPQETRNYPAACAPQRRQDAPGRILAKLSDRVRSEEHTSELQSLAYLV